MTGPRHGEVPVLSSTAPTAAHAIPSGTGAVGIRTPDQRARVFVSSTLQELADERRAAREAITRLRLTPVLFELGARPHPPRELYRAYLAQSDIFIGLYWQRYGWIAEEALTLAREVGDRAAAAFALRNLRDAHYRVGDLAAARTAYTESLATFRAVGDSWGAAITLGALAMLALVQGDAATVRSLNEGSLPLLRQVGNTWSLALVLVNLGAAVLQQSDDQQARDHFVEGLRLWRELGNQTGSMMGVAGLAGVAAAQGGPGHMTG